MSDAQHTTAAAFNQSCTTSGQVWPRSWLTLARSRDIWTDVCKLRPEVAKCWSNSVGGGYSIIALGSDHRICLAYFRRVCPKAGVSARNSWAERRPLRRPPLPRQRINEKHEAGVQKTFHPHGEQDPVVEDALYARFRERVGPHSSRVSIASGGRIRSHFLAGEVNQPRGRWPFAAARQRARVGKTRRAAARACVAASLTSRSAALWPKTRSSRRCARSVR